MPPQTITESYIMDSAHAAHSYFSTESQAITMETSVVHHGNMTWMSVVALNGFAAIKGARTQGIHIHSIHFETLSANMLNVYLIKYIHLIT